MAERAIEGITRYSPTLDRITLVMAVLAKEIPLEQYDTLLAPTRGGLIPAGLLSHWMPRATVVHTIKSERYCSDGSIKPEPDLSFMPNLHGRKVLLIDDIVDEGITVKAITEYYLRKPLVPNKVDVAALYVRDRSQHLVQWYGEVVATGVWVSFPWEPPQALLPLPF